MYLVWLQVKPDDGTWIKVKRSQLYGTPTNSSCCVSLWTWNVNLQIPLEVKESPDFLNREFVYNLPHHLVWPSLWKTSQVNSLRARIRLFRHSSIVMLFVSLFGDFLHSLTVKARAWWSAPWWPKREQQHWPKMDSQYTDEKREEWFSRVGTHRGKRGEGGGVQAGVQREKIRCWLTHCETIKWNERVSAGGWSFIQSWKPPSIGTAQIKSVKSNLHRRQLCETVSGTTRQTSPTEM